MHCIVKASRRQVSRSGLFLAKCPNVYCACAQTPISGFVVKIYYNKLHITNYIKRYKIT